MEHKYLVAIVGTQLLLAFFDSLNLLTHSHNVWLRDHCRCHECFHPITKQRLVDTFEVGHHQSLLSSALVMNFVPQKISEFIQPSEVTATNINLEVVWHGVTPHKSLYPWPWLWRNSYDPHFPEKTAEPSAPTAGTHECVMSIIQK